MQKFGEALRIDSARAEQYKPQVVAEWLPRPSASHWAQVVLEKSGGSMEIRSLLPMSSDIRSWSVEDLVALVTKLQVPHEMFRRTSSRARTDLAPGPQGREPQAHRPPCPRKQC